MRTQVLVLCLALSQVLSAQQSTQPKFTERPKLGEHAETNDAKNKTSPLPKSGVSPTTRTEDRLPHEPQPCCTEQRSEKPLNRLEKIKDFTDAFSPWLLVVIGLLGVIAALWTLGTMRQQARDNLVAINAARSSAEAASRSAEALIHSERAWVVVNSQRQPEIADFKGFFGLKALTIEVINRGRTPARFTGTTRINSKLAKLKDLPATPDFSPAWPGSPADSELMLSPNETLEVSIPIIPSENLDAANKAEISQASDGVKLFVYASLLYYAFGDTLGELGVCYAYIPDPSQPRFIRLGPQGYNKQI